MSDQNKQNIQGILLLDKPIGLSSNGALQRIKRLFRAKKAGHTGSLDPLATGMLPICFGEATKFSQFLLDSDKRYRVSMRLGLKTTTGDAEGEVIETRPVPEISSLFFDKVLKEFLGEIQQIPPMFSALKHQGKPLYRLARQGIEVERQPRVVQIFDLQRLDQENEPDTFSFDVHCSKGTYVRTLVEDIGERLNCGAHVSRLHRLAVTPYQETKMYSLDDLEYLCQQEGVEALHALLLPVETSVQALPAIKLSTSAAFYMRMGQPVIVPHLPTQGLVRVFADDGRFMGIGEIMDDGRVTPRRLVAAAA
jgi:tRNA pseudouridine55 synthase